jgi:hypothetical protein
MLPAQVGVNTNNPATGTLLHVTDDSDLAGVLMTKASLESLSSTNPLPSGIEAGTLIYNTNITLGKGYYSWDGDSWDRPNAYVGQMAKFLNPSSGGANLHAGNKAQVFGTTPSTQVFNDNSNLYQIVNSQNLTVTEAGAYQITVSLSMTASSGKAEVEARLRINNVGVGGYYRSSEMLNDPDILANGSISFTQTILLDANDTLSVYCAKAFNNNSGSASLRSAGSSSFFIQKLL